MDGYGQLGPWDNQSVRSATCSGKVGRGRSTFGGARGLIVQSVGALALLPSLSHGLRPPAWKGVGVSFTHKAAWKGKNRRRVVRGWQRRHPRLAPRRNARISIR